MIPYNTQAMPTKNYLAKCHIAAVEKRWSTRSLLQTYHLIHGVTGVVALRMCASDPHGLQELFVLLLDLLGRRLLWLFFFDGRVALLLARALAVTPPVFLLLPASPLLLPAWRTTSKGRGKLVLENKVPLSTLSGAFSAFVQMPCQVSPSQGFPSASLRTSEPPGLSV